MHSWTMELWNKLKIIYVYIYICTQHTIRKHTRTSQVHYMMIDRYRVTGVIVRGFIYNNMTCCPLFNHRPPPPPLQVYIII